MTIDDLKDVKDAIWDARSKWNDIGLQLSIRKPDLDAIHEDCRDVQQCLTEMLTLWLKRANPPPTWESMANALKQPSVEWQQLAEEIEKNMLSMCSTEQGEGDGSDSKISMNQESKNVNGLYKCGCGQCESEIGCPNPIPIDNTFPQISKYKDLNEEEKEVLEARLRADSKDIMVKFCKLHIAFYNSLSAREVPVKQLVTHLSVIDAFEPILVSKCPLLQEHGDVLDHVTDIEGVMKVIRLYSSFFNYEVLEHMIEQDGSDEDKQNLQKYKEDFFQYARRRIYECPSQVGDKNKRGHIDLVMKLDSKYDKYTLIAIKDLRVTLGKLLHITPETLYLWKIEDGCINLTFQIPHFVQEAILPLSAEQETTLLELGVLQLTCGDYHFPRQVLS